MVNLERTPEEKYSKWTEMKLNKHNNGSLDQSAHTKQFITNTNEKGRSSKEGIFLNIESSNESYG